MKIVLAFSLLLASISAFAAQEISVYGRGTAQSYCRANDMFCPRNLKDQAERQANQNAQWDCMNRRGQPLTYTQWCSSTCNPGYIPPNQDAFVYCQAECRMTCSLP